MSFFTAYNLYLPLGRGTSPSPELKYCRHSQLWHNKLMWWAITVRNVLLALIGFRTVMHFVL